MSEESPSYQKSITPTQPEVITLADDPKPPKHPKLILILSIIGMVLVILVLGGIKFFQISQAIAKGKSFKMPPDAVTSLTVKEEVVAPVLEAVGSLSSPQGVMLSADLPGIVKSISFESGTSATNGQLLVQLDTRQEEAQLRTAKSKLDLARQNGPKHALQAGDFLGGPLGGGQSDVHIDGRRAAPRGAAPDKRPAPRGPPARLWHQDVRQNEVQSAVLVKHVQRLAYGRSFHDWTGRGRGRGGRSWLGGGGDGCGQAGGRMPAGQPNIAQDVLTTACKPRGREGRGVVDARAPLPATSDRVGRGRRPAGRARRPYGPGATHAGFSHPQVPP